MSGRANGCRRGGSGSRWMDLRYAGTCKVCGAQLPAGSRAYWDAGARAVTCSALSCCEADELTTQQWSGPPVSGQFVAVRTDRRVGSAAPSVVVDPVQFGRDDVPQCARALRRRAVLRLLRADTTPTHHEIGEQSK